MRKLMWLSIGFGAACFLCAYLLSEQWVLAALLAVVPVCTGFCFLLRRWCWHKCVIYASVGLVAGMSWCCLFNSIYIDNVHQVSGDMQTLTVTAESYGQDTDYGTTVDGCITVDGWHYKTKIYLYDRYEVSPGDLITGRFRLQCSALGDGMKPTYNAGNGRFLLLYGNSDIEITPGNRQAIRYLPAQLRQAMLERIETLFPADAAPFIKALLLGDTTDLDYETDKDLSLSGIRHVAAVSGLHVSILFSLVYVLTGRRRILSLLAGLPFLLLFAAVAGFTPSVTRACIMQSLMLIALSIDRDYDSPTALAFAALVILVSNPLAITSVSLQLSVGSVAGIVLITPRIQNWLMDQQRFGQYTSKTFLGKSLRRVLTSVSITLGATIITAPLAAYHFGTLSLVSAITNLMCLWVVSMVFYGAMAVCLLGGIWASAAEILAAILAWPVRYILTVARVLSMVPGGAVYTCSVYITIWLVGSYLLLGAYLLWKKKRPVILAGIVFLGLVAALLCSFTAWLRDDYRIAVVDVGQGQCVFIHSAGRTYMVDCGSDDPKYAADQAAAYLRSQGITRLDGVILSHYDKDHVAAVPYLLTGIEADVLLLPAGPDGEDVELVLSKVSRAKQIYVRKDLTISWDEAEITVLASQDTNSSNESSLCVLFQREKCAILITGDRGHSGEAALVNTGKIPQLTALIVGHHGSDGSTGAYLLSATRPETAVISVGRDNYYGLPDDPVLRRLERYGCTIRRTDLEGTIILRG